MKGCRIDKASRSIVVNDIRALKRRLGESASPEGLIASFRTREVAEPAL